MKLMSFLSLFIPLLFVHGRKPNSSHVTSAYSYRTDLTGENWLTIESGRTVYLFGTVDKEKIKKFIPTGHKPEQSIIGQWKILLYPPVFYSNEENPDTSKDRSSSVLVYNLESSLSAEEKSEPVFVAKGYKFFIIDTPSNRNFDFVLRYYPGVMGCSLIDMGFSQSIKSPSIEYRSTKDYNLCEGASKFNQLDDF